MLVTSVPVLCARAVRVVAAGSVLLDGVDLDASAGASTVVVGPNGAGKTTLLEVLAGVRDHAAGEVTASGRIAFVPQRADVPGSLPLTALEVARMGAWRWPWGLRAPGEDDAARAALDRLAVTDLASRSFGALSGGQRQRVLLAQALARRADVLLLDEPTTGLDAASVELILAAIDAERARGAAIVAVTHDEALIAAAADIVRLDAGRRLPSGR